jgi:DNA-binding transcriptional regulator YhcF (GntR family)
MATKKTKFLANQIEQTMAQRMGERSQNPHFTISSLPYWVKQMFGTEISVNQAKRGCAQLEEDGVVSIGRGTARYYTVEERIVNMEKSRKYQGRKDWALAALRKIGLGEDALDGRGISLSLEQFGHLVGSPLPGSLRMTDEE